LLFREGSENSKKLLETKRWRDAEYNWNTYRWADIHYVLDTFKYDRPKWSMR